MIQKEIINFVAERTGIKKLSYIEKDLILHRLLVELSLDKQFSKNYAFKGGTCLMKCYFGYYRFSEDLDFTYINQQEWNNKSENQKRRIISEKINEISKSIKVIADRIGLDFKPEKDNRRYFLFGGSNKQVTFNLWYVSEGELKETFIKIQINFVDKLFYPVKMLHANNIFFGKYEDFEKGAFLLPKNSEWLLKIPKLKVYAIKEILVEKVRAILTRKGIKSRDFIDVFMIIKNKKIKLESLKERIIVKTKLMQKMYGKYASNIENKSFDKIDGLILRDEKNLLIKDIPEGSESFLGQLIEFLNKLIEELKVR